MIDRSDTERLVRVWLEDGPSAMPDRVITTVAERIARQPRHRVRRLPWRPRLNTQVKVLAALAAVLVIAFTGWSLLPRPASIGGPGPTPSPSATTAPSSSAVPVSIPPPTAAAYACDDAAFRCAGPLATGVVSTLAFRPHLTFTAPAGWANSLDRERSYTLKPADNGMFFQVMSQVAIPEQNSACTAQRKAGAGTSVADFVKYLTKHPGLVASTPEAVTLGGYSGMKVSVHVRPDWTARCPTSIGPAVELLTDTVAVPDRVVWIDDQYTTLWIVDVAGTTVIARSESGPSAGADARDQARVQPILDSFKFTVG
jgi:hypothetical protein